MDRFLIEQKRAKDESWSLASHFNAFTRNKAFLVFVHVSAALDKEACSFGKQQR